MYIHDSCKNAFKSQDNFEVTAASICTAKGGYYREDARMTTSREKVKEVEQLIILYVPVVEWQPPQNPPKTAPQRLA
jgi:hypothetical protein